MTNARASFVLLLTATAFAGCSAGDDPSLRSVYGDDAKSFAEFLPEGVEVPDDLRDILVIDGYHIEGRIGNGTWSPNVTFAVSASIAGPVMMAPAPGGGGGESTPLEVASETAQVRIAAGDRLEGYKVGWMNGPVDISGNASFAAILDPDEPYEFPAGFGSTMVTAMVLRAADDAAPAAIFQNGVRFNGGASFLITGTVHPFNPDPVNAGVPGINPRDEQVDKYTFTLAAPATVTASTVHTGDETDGADVDLAVVDANGAGILCSASGTGMADPAPDPGQSTESLTVEVGAGAYSIEVGWPPEPCPNTTGATTTGFYFMNAAPVPYELTIVIG